jgi:hypothetical protein|tara:strand:+ start:105 stop:296 length:192 start_codon:yes stop_codon:yes gene_type:complete
MKRIEKLGELLVRAITYPLRATIGVCRCIDKSTPDSLEDCMPFEIKSKRKENTNGSTETNDAR